MNVLVKSIVVASVPVMVLGGHAAVGAESTTQPATPPASQPVKEIAQNKEPLVIPDGTSGPVAIPFDGGLGFGGDGFGGDVLRPTTGVRG